MLSKIIKCLLTLFCGYNVTESEYKIIYKINSDCGNYTVINERKPIYQQIKPPDTMRCLTCKKHNVISSNFCKHCGSGNLKYSENNKGVLFYMRRDTTICTKCGHTSSFYEKYTQDDGIIIHPFNSFCKNCGTNHKPFELIFK